MIYYLPGYNCTLADIGISREILIKAFLRTKQYAYTYRLLKSKKLYKWASLQSAWVTRIS